MFEQLRVDSHVCRLECLLTPSSEVELALADRRGKVFSRSDSMLTLIHALNTASCTVLRIVLFIVEGIMAGNG